MKPVERFPNFHSFGQTDAEGDDGSGEISAVQLAQNQMTKFVQCGKKRTCKIGVDANDLASARMRLQSN